MNMQVMEVRVRLANEEFVKAYASICFDDCFLLHDIKVIKGPTGFSYRFPNRTDSEAVARYCTPVNAQTPWMIEQAVMVEYEKVIAQTD
jgi:stage V sporulation protein G